jgi:hypothetical protein
MLKEGIKINDQYGESQTRWWLFPKDTTDEDIYEYLEDCGYLRYGNIYSGYNYSPTGRWFSAPIYIKRKGTRVLAIQKLLLDC